jgi:hypothetical protein
MLRLIDTMLLVELGGDVLEIDPLARAVAALLVPVVDLEADHDAEHHDDQVDEDRRPLLVPHVFDDAAQDHGAAPALAAAPQTLAACGSVVLMRSITLTKRGSQRIGSSAGSIAAQSASVPVS